MMTNFLGIGIDTVTYQEMFEKVDGWIKNKDDRSHHIACVNAFCVTLTLKNERLRRIYNGGDIVGPDGMPFVKWIRLFRKQPCDRFYAPDVITQLAKEAKGKGYTFYLYGGSPEMCSGMKEYLEEKYPYIKIIGHYSPPFRQLTKDEDDAVVDEINRLQPDIISVGLGTPKQDYWIEEHIERIKGTVMVASGATFDFFGGRIKMAPLFIQQSGFEWLFRLFSRDFTRLFKRYTVMNIIFLWNFFLQLVRICVRKPERWIRA